MFAFGDQTVEQHREIGQIGVGGFAAGFADVLALILVEVGRVPQQPADQRRLAVIDGAARQQVHDAVQFAQRHDGFGGGRGSAAPDLRSACDRHQK